MGTLSNISPSMNMVTSGMSNTISHLLIDATCFSTRLYHKGLTHCCNICIARTLDRAARGLRLNTTQEM
jgi:hypothetical protein